MKVEGIKVFGLTNALIGMRLPMCHDYTEAKAKVDSFMYKDDSPMTVGEADLKVMKNLIKADDVEGKTGTPNSKFLRMIHVQMCVTAPIYWWKEMDTYKIGTTRNSSSTMHKLYDTPITLDCFEMVDSFSDFGDEGYTDLEDLYKVWEDLIRQLEYLRVRYNETKNQDYWKELIRLLPESWLQTAMLDVDYATLRNIYCWRKNHKLTEWHTFCKELEKLPLAKELIMNGETND